MENIQAIGEMSQVADGGLPSPASAAPAPSSRSHKRASRYNALCLTCRHPEADAISYALANGEPTAQAARRFNVSRTSLQRHRRNHIGEAAIQAARRRKILGDNRLRLEELKEDESVGLLARLAMIRGRLNIALAKAEEVGDLRAVALLSGQIYKGAELIAKLLGELAPSGGTTINVNQNNSTLAVTGSDLFQLRDLIERTLEPWPDARRALVSALAAESHAVTAR